MERSTTKVMDMDFLWFDSMKRSEEGTMKWQWGLHVALTGTAVVTPAPKWHGWKHCGVTLPGSRKAPLSWAWPGLVPNWPERLFKRLQRVARVWAESPRSREKLLLISLRRSQIYPQIPQMLLKSCSLWWMYGSTVKCSPIYRKHLETPTWCNASHKGPCELKWLWKNTNLSSVSLLLLRFYL